MYRYCGSFVKAEIKRFHGEGLRRYKIIDIEENFDLNIIVYYNNIRHVMNVLKGLQMAGEGEK